MNVFCALITTIGRSGRSFLMRGSRSKAFSSGITTSVMTRSPSPWLTQRQSVAALLVKRTSYPARDSAWFKTVRIAASSSATRMLPAGISVLSGSAARLGAVTRELGHQYAKGCPSRLRFTFDDPAMIADDLRHQCKTEAAAGRLGGDEGIEQVRQEVVWHAGAVVAHAELERQRHARLAAGQRQPHAGPERGGQVDLAVARALADRFGGVFHQVEEDLNQLVAVGEHRWQGRIVLLDELDVTAEAGLR